MRLGPSGTQMRVRVTKIYPTDKLDITEYTGNELVGFLEMPLEEGYPMIIREEDPAVPNHGIATSPVTGLIRKGIHIFVHTRNSIYQLEDLDEEKNLNERS